MDHEITTFACGSAAELDMIFAAKSLDELIEQDQENTGFVVLFRSNWYKYQFAAGWSAIAMATIKPARKDRTVVAVSPGGAYWEVDTKSREERNGSIKAAVNSIRSLAVVDEVIYASGMGRSILRRSSPG